MKYLLSLIALTSAVSSTDFATNTASMTWLEAIPEKDSQIVINGMTHWSEDKTFSVTMPKPDLMMAIKISGTEWEDIDVTVSSDMPAENTFTTAVWPSTLDTAPFVFSDAKIVSATGNVYSTYRGYASTVIGVEGTFRYVFTNKSNNRKAVVEVSMGKISFVDIAIWAGVTVGGAGALYFLM